MNLLALSSALAVVLAPAIVFFAVLARLLARLALDDPRPKRLGLSLTTFVLGALVFVPTWFAERWLRGLAGIDDHTAVTDVTALVYAFLVAAPLEQGVKVAAVGPVWRTRYFQAPLDGVAYAAATGLGFATAHDALFLAQHGASAQNLGRTLLAAPAHLFFAALWGYALGRDAKAAARAGAPQKRLGGRTFNLVWLCATAFNGVYDHIVFARGPVALLATTPILLSMVAIGGFALRELEKGARASLALSTPRRRLFSSFTVLAPPSIRAVRAALFRTERPVMLRWILIGALTTTGVMTSTLAAAVALGHRLGVDFAAVDQGEGAATASLPPLVLLGGAALAAFPIAGYLVARASATRSVLEPAIAAALAIAGTLILLGLAAPVAVVFAIAFAPVAFGLACAGAWVGIAS